MNLIQSNKFIVLMISCLILLPYSFSHAKSSYLIFGKTYPILEEDLLDYIKNRLTNMMKNGEWDAIKRKAIIHIKQQIERPKSLNYLTKTITNKSWHYDPSVRVPFDLTDHQGHIFARTGDLINPLKIRPLKNALIFFDADDDSQLKFVRKTIAKYNDQVKLILINGSILETNKKFQRPIYFDQQGKLTQKFNIQHVPAIVYQEGLSLKVSEVIP